VALTFAMAVVYTTLDVMQPREPVLSLLALAPGVVACASLLAAGVSPSDLRLRLAWPSFTGAAVLAGVTMLMVPVLASSTGYTGWRWVPALVYAPASGIAQELFFRSALLAALEHLVPHRPGVALVSQSAVFVAFHLRTLLSVSSLPIAFLVAAVILLGGCGWGWQVQRDRTIVWAIALHGLMLVAMSMFGWS